MTDWASVGSLIASFHGCESVLWSGRVNKLWIQAQRRREGGRGESGGWRGAGEEGWTERSARFNASRETEKCFQRESGWSKRGIEMKRRGVKYDSGGARTAKKKKRKILLVINNNWWKPTQTSFQVVGGLSLFCYAISWELSQKGKGNSGGGGGRPDGKCVSAVVLTASAHSKHMRSPSTLRNLGCDKTRYTTVGLTHAHRKDMQVALRKKKNKKKTSSRNVCTTHIQDSHINQSVGTWNPQFVLKLKKITGDQRRCGQTQMLMCNINQRCFPARTPLLPTNPFLLSNATWRLGQTSGEVRT